MTNAADQTIAQAEKAIPSIEAGVADVQKFIANPNTWVANLTSLVAVVFTVLAVFHPGFTEPPAVPAVIAAAGALVAGGAQIAHFVTRRSRTTKVIVAKINAGVAPKA